MSNSFSVTVEVTKPDGSSEHVRVGTATKSANGFAVTFFPMTLNTNGEPIAAPAGARRATTSSSGASSAGSSAGGAIFPPYGRSKGMPVAGATMNDLEFYANGSRRTLSDPSKARFHDKERAFLAVLEAEISRQNGGASPGDGFSAGPPDDGIPPPSDEDAPF